MHDPSMYAPDIAAVATPIGLVVIEGHETAITRIRVAARGEPRTAMSSAVREAAEQLGDYFAGRVRSFDLPLAPAITQRGALLRQAITDIGYGDTASYGQLARTLNSSARALGQACARNPFPLVVPCHRVLQAGGALGAYSAGDGPATKRWLLDFERCRA